MPEEKLDQLLKVLAFERSSILAADFEAVATLGEQKIALLEGLDEAVVDHEKLAIVKVDVAHNQSLLAAAISGVSAANARLAALSQVRSKLSFYNQSGQISEVSVAPPGVERKA